MLRQLFRLLCLVFLVSACRASDCGCPMAVTAPAETTDVEVEDVAPENPEAALCLD